MGARFLVCVCVCWCVALSFFQFSKFRNGQSVCAGVNQARWASMVLLAREGRMHEACAEALISLIRCPSVGFTVHGCICDPVVVMCDFVMCGIINCAHTQASHSATESDVWRMTCRKQRSPLLLFIISASL